MSIIAHIVKHASINKQDFNPHIHIKEIGSGLSNVNLLCFDGNTIPLFAIIEIEIFQASSQDLSINVFAVFKQGGYSLDILNLDAFQHQRF